MLLTKRLELIPASMRHLDCELSESGSLVDILCARIPDEWPPGEYDREAMAFFRSRLEAEGPISVGWYVWYALLRRESVRKKELVAGAGFHGPPIDGIVEIGFSVVPSARSRGYASEIIGALVEYAFDSGRVVEVVAETTEDNIACVKALLTCGFQRIGKGREPGMVRYGVRSKTKNG